MKKRLLLLGMIFSYLSSFGQIGIVENFDNGIPADWTSSFLASGVQACSGQSARDNVYSATNATGNLTSPNLTGQSNATDILDNEDVGFTSSYDPATNLLFDQEYFVTITPYNTNGDATGCEEQSFTTESAPQGSVCEDTIPVTEPLPYVTTDSTSNYEDDYSGSPGTDCGSTSSYLNGDDVIYEYTPTEDTSVDIILSDLSGTYAGMFIYSSCEDIGVECQNGITNGSSSADMEIQDYVVTGGETYYHSHPKVFKFKHKNSGKTYV